MDDVVLGAVRMFRAEATFQHIELVYTPPAPPVYIRGDAQRIGQMLANLLSNAIKYMGLSTSRRIDVRASVQTPANAAASPPFLVVSVADTGIGMTLEEQAALFVPYGVAAPRAHATYGQPTMGLFVTRELLSLMGGSITVQSVPTQGSTFVLEIPVTIVATNGTKPAPEAGTASALVTPGPVTSASPISWSAPPPTPVDATHCLDAGRPHRSIVGADSARARARARRDAARAKLI